MTSLFVSELIENSLITSPCAVEMNKTIFRAEHNSQNPYTMLSNALLRDYRLRNSDRGLLVYMLSFSDSHRVCIKAMVKRMPEGKDAITAMLGRLCDLGYAEKFTIKDSKGRFAGVVYHIYESPKGKLLCSVQDGITENQHEDEVAQLDLFTSPAPAMNNSNLTPESQNVKPSATGKPANGKPANGKPATNNKYIEQRIFNSNNPSENQNSSDLKNAVPETKESLLNKWHKKLSDHVVFSYLARAGLQTFINTQDDLDRFLIDFNQQYEKYQHLSESARMKNFVAYLVRVKHTPIEYRKHLARLKALGFDVEMPVKQNTKQAQVQARVKQQQVAVNPFESKPLQSLEVSPDFLKRIEGF